MRAGTAVLAAMFPRDHPGGHRRTDRRRTHGAREDGTMTDPVAEGDAHVANSKLSFGPSLIRQIFALAFFVGALAGLGTSLGDEFSSNVRRVAAKDFLIGSTALGAAFAAINIAVLALVAVWFDDTYQQVLRTRGGWVKAMRPFRIVATVSVLTTLAGILGLFVLAVKPVWPRAVMLGITGGLLLWSLIGSLVMIALLFEHGRDRAEMVQGLRDRRIAKGLPPKSA